MDELQKALAGSLFHMLRSATKTGRDVGADKVAAAILERNRVKTALASMDGKTLTPDELIELLAHLLAGAAGGEESEWAKLMRIERVNLMFDPSSNWRASAAGSTKQREAILKAVDVVRVEHPYVKWP
jgi:hypothetical protein